MPKKPALTIYPVKPITPQQTSLSAAIKQATCQEPWAGEEGLSQLKSEWPEARDVISRMNALFLKNPTKTWLFESLFDTLEAPSRSQLNQILHSCTQKNIIAVEFARMEEGVVAESAKSILEFEIEPPSIEHIKVLYTPRFLHIEALFELARNWHGDQKDKAGVDYVDGHLRAVHRKSAEARAPYTWQATAILHDILEDTKITHEELLLSLLQEPIAMTEQEAKDVVLAIKALSKQSNQSYDEYLTQVAENEIARHVKFFDLTHNSDLSRIHSPTEKDIARVEKYQKAKDFLIQYNA